MYVNAALNVKLAFFKLIAHRSFLDTRNTLNLSKMH